MSSDYYHCLTNFCHIHVTEMPNLILINSLITFSFEFHLMSLSGIFLILWMCISACSHNRLLVIEIILFTSDKLTHKGVILGRAILYFLHFCKCFLFMYRFVGHLCHFDFHKTCLKLDLCLYVEDSISKFFGLSCWVMLGLGKQTWLGICHLQIYTVSLFPSLWIGKCKRVSENRLCGLCFLRILKLPGEHFSLLLEQSY